MEAPLIIRSRWFNELTNEDELSDYTVTFPPGNYNVNTMLANLNAFLPAFSDSPYDGTVYGLGGTYIPVDPPINNPTSISTINSKFIFQQYQDILNQTIEGTVNEHIYQSFSFHFIPESYRLWVMLGLTNIQNPVNPFENPSDIVIPITLQSRTEYVQDSITYTDFTYTVGDFITGSFTFNFGNTGSLYVYLSGQVNTEFRDPFSSYKSSNLIARVPRMVPYGSTIVYQSQVPNQAVVKDLNISNLTIQIRDDFFELVDFQGSEVAIDWSIKFGMNETIPNISGYEGVPSNVASTPSIHYSAASYNSGSARDPLNNSAKRQRDLISRV